MPSVTAFEYCMASGNDFPHGFEANSDSQILFDSEPDLNAFPGFPCRLTIYRTPSENYQERALWLGQMLSDNFGLSVLVAFSHPDKPDDPYYDIVFQDGISYLADDSEVDLGEADAKPVRIIEPYPLPLYEFDSIGRFVGVIQ